VGIAQHLKHRLNPMTIAKEVYRHLTEKVLPHGANEVGNMLMSGSAYLPWPGSNGPPPEPTPEIEPPVKQNEFDFHAALYGVSYRGHQDRGIDMDRWIPRARMPFKEYAMIGVLIVALIGFVLFLKEGQMQAINNMFENGAKVFGFFLFLHLINVAIRGWMATNQPDKLKRLEEMEDRKRGRRRGAAMGTLKKGLSVAKWFTKWLPRMIPSAADGA
jgi:hypothetical protein